MLQGADGVRSSPGPKDHSQEENRPAHPSGPIELLEAGIMGALGSRKGMTILLGSGESGLRTISERK